jgi:hypothetical protein
MSSTTSADARDVNGTVEHVVRPRARRQLKSQLSQLSQVSDASQPAQLSHLVQITNAAVANGYLDAPENGHATGMTR